MVPSLLWLVLKSAAILYSKGKMALQAEGGVEIPRVLRAARISYHDKLADYISIAANPTNAILHGGSDVFSYGAGRGFASTGTQAFVGALANGTAVGIPAGDGDARGIVGR